MKYEIHADGICEPNPGLGAWAFVVFDENGKQIDAQYHFVGSGETNNTAEYRAVIEALVWAHELDQDEVVIKTDSKLVVEQLARRWNVSDKMRSWWDNANDLIEPHVKIEWIPGAENKADYFTRRAYQLVTGIWPVPRVKKNKSKIVPQSPFLT